MTRRPRPAAAVHKGRERARCSARGAGDPDQMGPSGDMVEGPRADAGPRRRPLGRARTVHRQERARLRLPQGNRRTPLVGRRRQGRLHNRSAQLRASAAAATTTASTAPAATGAGAAPDATYASWARGTTAATAAAVKDRSGAARRGDGVGGLRADINGPGRRAVLTRARRQPDRRSEGQIVSAAGAEGGSSCLPSAAAAAVATGRGRRARRRRSSRCGRSALPSPAASAGEGDARAPRASSARRARAAVRSKGREAAPQIGERRAADQLHPEAALGLGLGREEGWSGSSIVPTLPASGRSTSRNTSRATPPATATAIASRLRAGVDGEDHGADREQPDDQHRVVVPVGGLGEPQRGLARRRRGGTVVMNWEAIRQRRAGNAGDRQQPLDPGARAFLEPRSLHALLPAGPLTFRLRAGDRPAPPLRVAPRRARMRAGRSRLRRFTASSRPPRTEAHRRRQLGLEALVEGGLGAGEEDRRVALVEPLGQVDGEGHRERDEAARSRPAGRAASGAAAARRRRSRPRPGRRGSAGRRAPRRASPGPLRRRRDQGDVLVAGLADRDPAVLDELGDDQARRRRRRRPRRRRAPASAPGRGARRRRPASCSMKRQPARRIRSARPQTRKNAAASEAEHAAARRRAGPASAGAALRARSGSRAARLRTPCRRRGRAPTGRSAGARRRRSSRRAFSRSSRIALAVPEGHHPSAIIARRSGTVTPRSLPPHDG